MGDEPQVTLGCPGREDTDGNEQAVEAATPAAKGDTGLRRPLVELLAFLRRTPSHIGRTTTTEEGVGGTIAV